MLKKIKFAESSCADVFAERCRAAAVLFTTWQPPDVVFFSFLKTDCCHVCPVETSGDHVQILSCGVTPSCLLFVCISVWCLKSSRYNVIQQDIHVNVVFIMLYML